MKGISSLNITGHNDLLMWQMTTTEICCSRQPAKLPLPWGFGFWTIFLVLCALISVFFRQRFVVVLLVLLLLLSTGKQHTSN